MEKTANTGTMTLLRGKRNYRAWLEEVASRLMRKGLWQQANTAPASAITPEEQRMRDQALGLIRLTLAPVLRSRWISQLDPQKLLKELKVAYGTVDSATGHAQLAELLLLTAKSEETVEQFFDRMMLLGDSIKSSGITVAEETFIQVLLNAWGDQFLAVKLARQGQAKPWDLEETLEQMVGVETTRRLNKLKGRQQGETGTGSEEDEKGQQQAAQQHIGSALYCVLHGQCGHESEECHLIQQMRTLLEQQQEKGKPGGQAQKTPEGQPGRTKQIQCYRCKEYGHVASKCPQKGKGEAHYGEAYVLEAPMSYRRAVQLALSGKKGPAVSSSAL